MPDKMYRKEAVDHMVSAEELDQAPHSIKFQGRALIGMCTLLITGFAVFSWFVKIPVTVKSEGIIWTPAGMHELTVNTSGIVTKVLVAEMGTVKKGDVILVVDQSDLKMQLDGLLADQKNTRAYIASLKELQSQGKNLRKDYSAAVKKIQDASGKRYREKEARLAKREKELQGLRNKGIIEDDKYTRLIDEIAATRESMGSLDKDDASRKRETLLSDIQVRKEILAQQHQADQAAGQIASLRNKILDKGEVRSPFTGHITEIDVSTGDFVTPGKAIATLHPDESETNLLVLVYAAYQDGAKMRSGMPVQMELAAYPKDKYGLLVGKISAISELPMSTQSMMRSLKNDQLVQRLAGDGAPFEVKVALVRDPADPSGFKWSSGSGEARRLHSGMKATSKVIIRRRRLLHLFTPEPF